MSNRDSGKLSTINIMDLIFWRHAEAFEALEGQDDLSRTLTPKGEKQALRMSQWLDRQLPEGVRVMSSLHLPDKCLERLPLQRKIHANALKIGQ